MEGFMTSITANPAAMWTLGVAGALVALYTFIQRIWRPMRRFVAMMDVILGRPPRYESDPEARPGIVQRLDDIDRNVCRLDKRVSRVEQHITNTEEST